MSLADVCNLVGEIAELVVKPEKVLAKWELEEALEFSQFKTRLRTLTDRARPIRGNLTPCPVCQKKSAIHVYLDKNFICKMCFEQLLEIRGVLLK
jgi:hypothetical protein